MNISDTVNAALGMMPYTFECHELRHTGMKTSIKIFVALFACIAAGNSLHGQDAERYVLKSGESISKVFPKAVYRYPEFMRGTVVFKNGNRTDANLNYNLWREEIQFVQPAGDTLSLDNEKTIDYIIIGSDSFIYDNIFLELVKSGSVAKLAGRQRIVIRGREKIGAYGQPTSTAAIDSYQYFTKSENQRLNVRENLILGKRMSFYLGDRFNHFVPASKKNLIKLFPKRESDIARFLKENEIDFDERQDLENLLGFLNAM